MGLPTGTICSKHDKIADLATEISTLVHYCKEDGQRMENALDAYKEQIKELNGTVERLTQELTDANNTIEELSLTLGELQ